MSILLSRAVRMVSAVILLTAGCYQNGENHPSQQHAECTYDYNTTWSSLSLDLVHSDERDCPFQVNVGETAYTGGTVYDNNWPTWKYPDYPFPGDGWAVATDLELYIYDDINDANSLIKFEGESFYWGQSRSGPTAFEWQSGMSVGYSAGQSPDFGLFIVDIDDITANAEALMTVSYWGTQH